MAPLVCVLLFILPLGSFGQAPAETQSATNLNSDASSLRVPYMTPMILGRTYDYSTNEVGDDIFDQAARNQKQTIKHYRTNIQYKMVSDIKDVQDVLEIKGELSLKVKAGLLDIQGSGSYLKEESDKTNFVEVLVKVEYESITETLHNSIKPVKNWKMNPTIGKHYVRSITYGGMLIASMRFYAKSGKSLQDIQAEIDGKVNAAALSVGVQGQFKKLTSSVSDTSDLVIKYYSTVMLENVPQNQTGLEAAIANFPNLVKQQKDENGNVRGVPLYSNVVSLSTLDPGSTQLEFIYDSLLVSHLGDMEEMYDDLLSTDRLIKGWLKNQYKLEEDNEVKVATFYQKLTEVITTFETTIAEMNTECDKTAAEDSENSCGFSKLENAFTAYAGEGKPSPKKYFREFCKVQESIELAGESLQDVGKEISNKRKKIAKLMDSKVNRDFGRILGIKYSRGGNDKLEAEFKKQDDLTNSLLEKGANVLPGNWFHADLAGEVVVSDLDVIRFTERNDVGEMFSSQHGCMKAPSKGIYLIIFHLLKGNDVGPFGVTLNIRADFEDADVEVVSRSIVEDDPSSKNCATCDHAVSQTLSLNVNLNFYVCLELSDGELQKSAENYFSALQLRKLE